MRDLRELDTLLARLDGAGYGAYRALKGGWAIGPGLELHVDHVQGDPFAAPSRVRVHLDAAYAGFDGALLQSEARRTGVAALLARVFSGADRPGHPSPPGARHPVGRRTEDGGAEGRGRGPGGRRGPGRAAEGRESGGSGRSGEIRMEHPGQVVGRQTAVQLHPDGEVEARFTVGLPARGRRILGRAARTLLTRTVPDRIEATLPAAAHDPRALLRAAETQEDQEALRSALLAAGLVAFIADGALLPRRSGRDDRPLPEEEAVLFRSPESLRVTLDTPNSGPITGMGIPEGVTLIVGGGFHGKSTLLRAIERGVRNHAPGDGRERVVTRADAVKVRAEDGRSVAGVDISPFIGELPGGRRTGAFTTPNASGSTSQAAAIMEALEVGASTLLVDEDTAATNLMIRDRRMQQLVPADREPITPFIDRVRALYREAGVSSVLVLGGSGDYLDVADTVLAMHDFHPTEVTARAREVAAATPTGREAGPDTFPWSRAERVPAPGSVSARRGRRPRRIRVHPGGILEFGEERIDLSSIEQIASEAELRTVGYALATLAESAIDGSRSIPEMVRELDARLDAEGLDVVAPSRPGTLAQIRPFEVAAALNRLRTLRLR